MGDQQINRVEVNLHDEKEIEEIKAEIERLLRDLDCLRLPVLEPPPGAILRSGDGRRLVNVSLVAKSVAASLLGTGIITQLQQADETSFILDRSSE
ncbi:1955_t:CDS:2 [Ambispora gerdemannii]|uniref:1955_t:CDS:1 n=1 Tax=Ambispora gerdemannii TaxID=144530 RepID=A0A9N8W0X8_9GLOM|nr:1955_t:CDS:2 [Ambispora gerdemannii]